MLMYVETFSEDRSFVSIFITFNKCSFESA